MRGQLTEPYIFDWNRIKLKDAYHIEYCITDICNKNCVACSHLAPLAKEANFVSIEDFFRHTEIISRCLLDVHTFWLTGGEPTLHPQFIDLLKIAREFFQNSFVGIYTNGVNLHRYENEESFWIFIRDNGIVVGITLYDNDFQYYKDLFQRHNCFNNLTLIQSGKHFFNLTNYSTGQAVSFSKFEQCGWERSKINIRNGKIYNCPSSEFADLFNSYFGDRLIVGKNDYLEIDKELTREKIEQFRGPIPFCAQCDINKRYKKVFRNEPSKRDITEWSCF